MKYGLKKDELDQKNKHHFFLRVKKINIRAGSAYIILINQIDADRLGIMPGDELKLDWENKSIELYTDISSDLVKEGEFGLFLDIFDKRQTGDYDDFIIYNEKESKHWLNLLNNSFIHLFKESFQDLYIHLKNTMLQIKDFKDYVDQTVDTQGWVMNKRSGKGLEFIILRDGSGFAQCIVDQNEVGEDVFETAKRLSQETSVKLSGVIVQDEKQIGGYEMHVKDISVLGESVDYPISNKEHGIEFLMDNRHLWLRSRRQWAILRVRNRIIMAIHAFFQKEGFVQADSPIFTGNAAEGATTLFSSKFYEGELGATALGEIYTFGPTFRAEKSKTRRHLSEFWMIEPEMAFFDNDMNMDLIEAFIKYVVADVLEHCKEELDILERDTSVLKTWQRNRSRD